jgi:spore coat polysaccharide biosynthesis predicted glycosyltransferase SpsG
LKLPTPTPSYDPRDQANVRRLIESDNANIYKRNQDVEIGSRKISPPNRLIISSPNGTRYEILVSNIGVLTASAV